MRPFGRVGRGDARRFLDHEVRVRAAEPEGTHARAARGFAARPCGAFGRHAEGRGVERDARVRLGEVDAGRDDLVLERERGLDDAHGGGARVKVADVGLDRPDGAEPRAIGRGAEGARQPLDLDGVAEQRAGPVRLDVAHAVGADAGAGLRLGNHLGLP
jgi:hypothetical protein